ncbi:MAG: threonylcarbamoyl-AMP synthase [Acidobacteria bacterium]|nr:threonylcarbamoyl-AMP synthase [Acidobacteriota bacterium]
MAEIIKVDYFSPQPLPIACAAEVLRRGEVVAIPTDTFYGLAANPFDVAAIEKVLAIKGRPGSNPLLLLIDSLEMAAALSSSLPPLFHSLANRFWPGALTIVVEASAALPPAVTGNTGTIGLRLPRAEVPLALVRKAGFPITATSANRTGEPPCFSAREVEKTLGQQLKLILDAGPSHRNQPSTVVRVKEDRWEVLREGTIPREELAACLETSGLGTATEAVDQS